MRKFGATVTPRPPTRLLSVKRAHDPRDFCLGRAYIDFMMEEGDARVGATYGDNHARLVSVKKAYDPANFFRVNQNIAPA